MDGQLDNTSRPERRGAFILLFCCLFAVGAGNMMLTSTVLPPLTRELGLPDWTAGAIFSLSAGVWVITAPFWGAKSNTWGRRPVTAIGMAGFAISMLLFGAVSLMALLGWMSGWVLIFVLLLFARTLFGVFGSATNPAAQAYVADRTTREERTDEIATLTSGFTLGQVAGPAAAGVLMGVGGLLSPTFGMVAPTFVICIIAAVIGWIVYRKLPEHRSPKQDASVGKPTTKGLWRHPAILPYLIYAVGLSLVTGVLSQSFPYVIMDRLHVTGTEAASATAPPMTIGAMATLIAQLVIIPRFKLPVRSLMVYGAIMLALASVFMIWAQDFALFAFSQMLIGFGQGLGRPGFSAGASLAADQDQQGDVAGLITAANGMGFVVSPLFGLWMYENISPASPFIFCAIVLTAMAIYAWFTAQKVRPTKEVMAKETAPSE
ncbi:MAG TPA: MFS transporter [Hyphomonadaceae bacterium]|jgi:MFS family permease|nr:MFS transporter [Hyphomonadaceae bacterium]